MSETPTEIRRCGSGQPGSYGAYLGPEGVAFHVRRELLPEAVRGQAEAGPEDDLFEVPSEVFREAVGQDAAEELIAGLMVREFARLAGISWRTPLAEQEARFRAALQRTADRYATRTWSVG